MRDGTIAKQRRAKNKIKTTKRDSYIRNPFFYVENFIHSLLTIYHSPLTKQ